MGGARTASRLLFDRPRPGLSNIIGVIVHDPANAGEPGLESGRGEEEPLPYGWSFYFGGLSFILAEVIGVLAVNIYIERSREAHRQSRSDLLKAGGGAGGSGGSGPSAIPPPSAQLPLPLPPPLLPSSRSSEPSPLRDASPGGAGGPGFASTDISMAIAQPRPIQCKAWPRGWQAPVPAAGRTAAAGARGAGRRQRWRRGGRGAGPARGRPGFLTLHNAFPKEAGRRRHGHGHRRQPRPRPPRPPPPRPGPRDPSQGGRRLQHQHAQQENHARVGARLGARRGRVRGACAGACNEAAGGRGRPLLPRERAGDCSQFFPAPLPCPIPAHPAVGEHPPTL